MCQQTLLSQLLNPRIKPSELFNAEVIAAKESTIENFEGFKQYCVDILETKLRYESDFYKLNSFELTQALTFYLGTQSPNKRRGSADTSHRLIEAISLQLDYILKGDEWIHLTLENLLHIAIRHAIRNCVHPDRQLSDYFAYRLAKIYINRLDSEKRNKRNINSVFSLLKRSHFDILRLWVKPFAHISHYEPTGFPFAITLTIPATRWNPLITQTVDAIN